LGGALAASFALGVVTSGLWRAGARSESAAWADPIAAYQSLYTRDTVGDVDLDAAHTARVLAAFGTRIGRPLSVPDLRAEGLAFKRAQLLSLHDAPVLQLVYLGSQGRPVALCLLPQSGGDAPVAWRIASGMDVAAWRHAGVGYALVGDQGRDRSIRLAQDLAADRFPPLGSS
jgi:anti-sigma factor RsiW